MGDVCIFITRGGYGSIFSAPSRHLCQIHPAFQYGDAVVAEAEDLLDQYNRTEWGALCDMLGVDLSTEQRDILLRGDWREAERERKSTTASVWRKMLERARPAPSDPADIVSVIEKDRRAVFMAKKKEAKVEAAVEKAAVVVEEKAAAKPGLFRADAKITTLVTTNPRRVGTGRHSRMQYFLDNPGLTVQNALEHGIATTGLRQDSVDGLISIEGSSIVADVKPAKPAKPAKESKPKKKTKKELAAEAEAEAAGEAFRDQFVHDYEAEAEDDEQDDEQDDVPGTEEADDTWGQEEAAA